MPGIPKRDHLRFITKEVSREDSPIHGWKTGLVEKIVSAISTRSSLAEAHKMIPVTLWNLNETMRDTILKTFISSMDVHALCLIGDPGFGKSWVARSAAMALARRAARITQADQEPEIKTAPEMDFFRGELGATWSS